jgi:hypothetical protein
MIELTDELSCVEFWALLRMNSRIKVKVRVRVRVRVRVTLDCRLTTNQENHRNFSEGTRVPAGIRPGNLSNICQKHCQLKQLNVFKSSILWVTTPCRPLEVNRRFEETHHRHFMLAACILVSFSAYSTTLKIEASRSFESSVCFQRRYSP